MKKRCLVTLDENLINKVKKDYKLSTLINRLLKQFVEQTLSPEELQIKLGIINSKIYKDKVTIKTVKDIKTKSIETLEKEACVIGERLIRLNK